MKLIQGAALGLALTLATTARAGDERADSRRDERALKGHDQSKDAVRLHKAAAFRHVTSANVALEQAKLALQGLYALVDDEEGALDAEHGKALVASANTGIKTAANHLQKLVNAPSEEKEAPLNVTKAQTELARVQAELKSLEKPVRTAMRGSGGDATPEQRAERDARTKERREPLKRQVKIAWEALDEARDAFKKVADDHKVTTRLPDP